MALPLLLRLLCSLCTLCLAARYQRKFVSIPATSVEEHWFEQKLDHFDGAERRIWKQRYFKNDALTSSEGINDGPVFLMIGGEGPANPAWMTSGAWLSYAQKLGAVCLMLEHRFYGKSHPTEDMSTSNLRYLSSRQALADLAHFQTVMTQKLGLGNRKWVAFGGSYPGSLAAWYRLKYPHLVTASIASSAPLNAVVNFSGYLEVVQQSLASYNIDCPQTVKTASETLVMMLLDKANYGKITKDFKAMPFQWKDADPWSGRRVVCRSCEDQSPTHFSLCERLQVESEMDSAYFLETMAGNFMDVVQYNKDNRAFEGVKGTNITIQVLCDVMLNVSLGTPYDRYAAVVRLMQQALEIKCVDASYKKFVHDMSNTTWEGPAAAAGRQWVYQTCTEFGFFQSTDSAKQPFSGFPLSYHVQQCTDIYGPEFNLTMVVDAAQQTNENYGGCDIQGRRIAFPNGGIDPWHVLGLVRSTSLDLPIVFMNDAAHCANMYPERVEDSMSVRSARQYIYFLLRLWLQD
ncbi:putative serine protease K12H4.7 isoform X3 [Ambystoma mexicanum]|uniref:putative serine protease K12H4.7 isoform X3 n=1 Tax=Ambystoma mexicanum TaxID=8296 RepID=UPI0037E7C04A